MKKAVSLLLTACILLSALSVNVFAADTAEIVSAYDYNNDGKVSIKDVREILRVSSGVSAPDENKRYDLDGDGFVTYYDVQKVLCIATGIDTDVSQNEEYLLGLFTEELNGVKKVRPGFTRETFSQCTSSLITIKSDGGDSSSSLDVTDVELSKYVDDLLSSKLASVIPESYKKQLRDTVEATYSPKTSTSNVAKGKSAHNVYFPVSGYGTACYLNSTDDIESIVSYEKDGYIYREVTMKEYSYIGDEYPTGNSSASKTARKELPYGKVFNIPPLTETDSSGAAVTEVKKVTFKDGKIVSKVDKLTGMPVSVEYSYNYYTEIASVPGVDDKGNKDPETTMKSTFTSRESYTIKPVEVA